MPFIKIMDSVCCMSPVPAFFPLLSFLSSPCSVLSAIKSDQYTPAEKMSSNVTKSILRQREKKPGSVEVEDGEKGGAKGPG